MQKGGFLTRLSGISIKPPLKNAYPGGRIVKPRAERRAVSRDSDDYRLIAESLGFRRQREIDRINTGFAYHAAGLYPGGRYRQRTYTNRYGTCRSICNTGEINAKNGIDRCSRTAGCLDRRLHERLERCNIVRDICDKCTATGRKRSGSVKYIRLRGYDRYLGPVNRTVIIYHHIVDRSGGCAR